MKDSERNTLCGFFPIKDEPSFCCGDNASIGPKWACTSMHVSSWAGWTRVSVGRAVLLPWAYRVTCVICGRGGDFSGKHLLPLGEP